MFGRFLFVWHPKCPSLPCAMSLSSVCCVPRFRVQKPGFCKKKHPASKKTSKNSTVFKKKYYLCTKENQHRYIPTPQSIMKKFLLLTLTLCFAQAVCFAQAKVTTYDYKDSLLVIKKKNYEGERYARCDFHLEIPELGDNACTDSIFDMVCSMLMIDNHPDAIDYNLAMKQAAKEFMMEDKKLREENEEDYQEIPPYSLDINIYVDLNNEDFVTLIYNSYEYLGGAHGMPYLGGITYNLKRGKSMEWKDFFRNKEFVRPFLTKAFTNPESDEYDTLDWEEVFSYTNSTARNYPLPYNDPWLDKKLNINFQYSSYEIGPYASGSPYTAIPAEKLTSILNSSLKLSLGRYSNIK